MEGEDHELIKRLNHLHDDLRIGNEEAVILKACACESEEDMREIMTEMFFDMIFCIPVQDYKEKINVRSDIYRRMDHLSEELENFIGSARRRGADIIRRRNRAYIMLQCILKLQPPYSRILYLKYFMGLKTCIAIDRSFLSRATYYRYHGEAVKRLSELIKRREEYDEICKVQRDTDGI